MHENMTILGLILIILGYGYYSAWLSRHNITGPMIFTTIGILLSPLGLGKEILHIDGELVQTMAEIALIVVLFADASTLDMKEFKKDWRIPTRMLAIGLPLTIVAAATCAGYFFPGEPKLYLLLLALLLAPTDAALGKAVVTDPSVPKRIRATINVESGLNDGIVFPILITVVLLIQSGGEGSGEGWLFHLLQQIVMGIVMGLAVGWAGARQTEISLRHGWLEHSYRNLVPFALAIFAYYASEFLGGNGYIGAFVAGLSYGNLIPKMRKNIEEFVESEGELFIMIIFTLFGLVFIPLVAQYWDLNILLYTLLSLTVLRMVPVALSLVGLRLDLPTILFVGWFGPRGIASILYVIIVVHMLGGSIAGHEEIFATVALTVLLSIFAHGISAKSLVNLYARYLERSSEERKESNKRPNR